MELTTIAAVVIGGMALTGGEGYLIGGLFGVLITALIQSLIQFNGQLSSWWTSIVIGGLMLVFIGVQSHAGLAGTPGSCRPVGSASRAAGRGMARRRRPWRDRRVLVGAVVVVAVFVGLQVIGGRLRRAGRAARAPRCRSSRSGRTGPPSS